MNSEVDNSNDNSDFGGLDPPRFTLRRLFLVVGLVAFCLAAFVNLPPMVTGGILFTAALIGLHVLGNAMGVRLRGGSRNELVGDRISTAGKMTERLSTYERKESFDYAAPPTKLSHTSSLGWPMLTATAVGTLAGGVGAYFAMRHFYSQELETEAFVIGVLAAAALGGFWFFWCWSLLQVLGTAWWHAHSSATIDQARTRKKRQ